MGKSWARSQAVIFSSGVERREVSVMVVKVFCNQFEISEVLRASNKLTWNAYFTASSNNLSMSCWASSFSFSCWAQGGQWQTNSVCASGAESYSGSWGAFSLLGQFSFFSAIMPCLQNLPKKFQNSKIQQLKRKWLI